MTVVTCAATKELAFGRPDFHGGFRKGFLFWDLAKTSEIKNLKLFGFRFMESIKFTLERVMFRN